MACRRVVKKDWTVAKLVGSGKKEPCAFCGHEADDEIIYGKLYAIGNIQCHYFCVLLICPVLMEFSCQSLHSHSHGINPIINQYSGEYGNNQLVKVCRAVVLEILRGRYADMKLLSCCLVQRGKDEDGLLGFLYPDILAEIERSKKHKCSYCSRGGATLGCSVGQCRKQFHLPCGRERQAVSLFYDNYRSYCKDHAPKQKVADNVMAKALVRMREHNKMKKNIGALRAAGKKSNGPVSVDNEGAGGPVCVICCEPVPGFPTPSTFWPPCCARDAWFHRTCLQRMALSAGMHYLKCPLCNDKDVFYQAVVTNGYYVPDRDAAWEMEQDAFADMYERAARCEARACRCPAGRRHDADTGPWDIKMCLLCGSCGVHAQCMLPSPPGSPAAVSPPTVPPPEVSPPTVPPPAVPPPARYVCPTCSPAAPADLDQLESSIAAVILTERSVGGGAAAAARRGPVMPSRMSLRRTKMRPHPSASASSSLSSNSGTECALVAAPKASTTTSLSRQELNLYTPRKPPAAAAPEPPRPIDNRLASPMKLLEQGVREQLAGRGATIDDRVLDAIRRKFKKPRPLSVKRRIVNGILKELLSNKKQSPKSKGPLRIWISPKKCHRSEDPVEAQLNGSAKENRSVTPKKHQTPTTVSLETTPIKIVVDEARAECIRTSIDNEGVFVEDIAATDAVESVPELVAANNNTSLETLDTPKKLTTVDIRKDSSMEISERDEVVNIVLIKIEDVSGGSGDLKIKDVLLKSPVPTKKCALKFSPDDKERLETCDVGIDVESFKNRYLNEVDREFRCTFSHNHERGDHCENSTLKTAIDFAYEAASKLEEKGSVGKRKLDDENVPKKKMKTANHEDAVLDREELENTTVDDEKSVICKNPIENRVRRKAQRRQHKTVIKKVRRKKADASATGDAFVVSREDRVSKRNATRKVKKSRNKDTKTLSIKDKNINVKIRFRRNEFNVNIKSNKRDSKRRKNRAMATPKKLKQYVLKYSPEVTSPRKIIARPDKDLTPRKRKYVRHEKSSDKLVQTSIDNFFKLKFLNTI